MDRGDERPRLPCRDHQRLDDHLRRRPGRQEQQPLRRRSGAVRRPEDRRRPRGLGGARPALEVPRDVRRRGRGPQDGRAYPAGVRRSRFGRHVLRLLRILEPQPGVATLASVCHHRCAATTNPNMPPGIPPSANSPTRCPSGSAMRARSSSTAWPTATSPPSTSRPNADSRCASSSPCKGFGRNPECVLLHRTRRNTTRR